MVYFGKSDKLITMWKRGYYLSIARGRRTVKYKQLCPRFELGSLCLFHELALTHTHTHTHTHIYIYIYTYIYNRSLKEAKNIERRKKRESLKGLVWMRIKLDFLKGVYMQNGGEKRRTVRCRACLILSECYSLNLSLWFWRKPSEFTVFKNLTLLCHRESCNSS